MSNLHSVLQTKTKHKSSTEAQIVAVDNAMGWVLWLRHFLATQGQQCLKHQSTKTIKKSTSRKCAGIQQKKNPASECTILFCN